MQNRHQEQSTILCIRDDVGQMKKILKYKIMFVWVNAMNSKMKTFGFWNQFFKATKSQGIS